MKYFCLAMTLVFIGSCTQAPVKQEGLVSAPSPEEYAAIVEKKTVKTNQYSGFYQTFQADMTMLSTEMQTQSLRRKANFLQWDEKQFQQEREKVLQEASGFSRFFLRFYSPERDYDDLSKGKTIWKVYLDASGHRFEGKVRKMKDKFVEIQTLFPHMDRFSTPYEITFSVPMTTLEQGPCKVTLTSSLGSAEFVFP